MNLVSFGSSSFSMYKGETIPPSLMLIDCHILLFGRTNTFSSFVLRLDTIGIEDSLGNADGEKDDTLGERPANRLICSKIESMSLPLDVLKPILLLILRYRGMLLSSALRFQLTGAMPIVLV